MTADRYAKIKANRDRHQVVTGRIQDAQTLLDQVRQAPKDTVFAVGPDGSNQQVGKVNKEVLCAALRRYLDSKDEVLTEIDLEFRQL